MVYEKSIFGIDAAQAIHPSLLKAGRISDADPVVFALAFAALEIALPGQNPVCITTENEIYSDFHCLNT